MISTRLELVTDPFSVPEISAPPLLSSAPFTVPEDLKRPELVTEPSMVPPEIICVRLMTGPASLAAVSSVRIPLATVVVPV